MSEDDLWLALKQFTPARLGLGRAGPGLPTAALLDFGIAHAQARDAVHAAVDWALLAEQLSAVSGLPCTRVESQAQDRSTYLRRPDLGRRLTMQSTAQVSALAQNPDVDVALVFADGLSAAALQHQAVPMLAALLETASQHRFGPILLAQNARVALGDDIGALLKARFVVVAIGERPGLSCPDSLGLYLTYAPRLGRHDAERNCLSNIHGAGLPFAVAARKLNSLLDGARRLQATGTVLKDETDATGRLSADGASAASVLGPGRSQT